MSWIFLDSKVSSRGAVTFSACFRTRAVFLRRSAPSSSSTDVAGSKEAWRIVFASEMACETGCETGVVNLPVVIATSSGGASEKLRHRRKIVGNWICGSGLVWQLCHSTFSEMPNGHRPRPVHTLVYEDGEEAKLLQWTQPQENTGRSRKIWECLGQSWDGFYIPMPTPFWPHPGTLWSMVFQCFSDSHGLRNISD